MGAVTGTVLGGATLAKVLTGAAVGSQAASGFMSFAQAGKQRKAQRKAEADAQRYAEEARKKLGVNFMDELAIQKEPYELQREVLLSQGAAATQAAREGDQRGVGATTGRIQQAMNEGQAGVRTAMGQDMLNLDTMSARQDQSNARALAQLSKEQAMGAEAAAADAQNQRAAAMQSGFSSLTGALGTGLNAIPLYQKGQSAKAADDILGMIGSNQVDRGLITQQLGLDPDATDEMIQSTLLAMDPAQINKLNFTNTIEGVGFNTTGVGLTPLPGSISRPMGAFDINKMNPTSAG